MRQTRFDSPLFLRITQNMRDRLRECANQEEKTESEVVRQALRDRLQPAPVSPA